MSNTKKLLESVYRTYEHDSTVGMSLAIDLLDYIGDENVNDFAIEYGYKEEDDED